MNETRSQKNTGNRKASILESVATMLEKAPGDKITIAKIAADVGVSEAAIYRHFASKAQIFEALITFAEEALLSRINTIHASDQSISVKTQDFMLLLLTFLSATQASLVCCWATLWSARRLDLSLAFVSYSTKWKLPADRHCGMLNQRPSPNPRFRRQRRPRS